MSGPYREPAVPVRSEAADQTEARRLRAILDATHERLRQRAEREESERRKAARKRAATWHLELEAAFREAGRKTLSVPEANVPDVPDAGAAVITALVVAWTLGLPFLLIAILR